MQFYIHDIYRVSSPSFVLLMCFTPIFTFFFNFHSEVRPETFLFVGKCTLLNPSSFRLNVGERGFSQGSDPSDRFPGKLSTEELTRLSSRVVLTRVYRAPRRLVPSPFSLGFSSFSSSSSLPYLPLLLLLLL